MKNWKAGGVGGTDHRKNGIFGVIPALFIGTDKYDISKYFKSIDQLVTDAFVIKYPVF